MGQASSINGGVFYILDFSKKVKKTAVSTSSSKAN